MPINLPNGNDVEEIVLPNGANASEVYGPNGKLVWDVIPDSVVLPEDGDLDHFSGDTADYSVVSSPTLTQDRALEGIGDNSTIISQSGLNRYPEPGFVWATYINHTVENASTRGTIFGAQDENNNYLIYTRPSAATSFEIRKDKFSTSLDSTGSDNFSTGEWLEIEVEWYENGDIIARLFEVDQSTGDRGSQLYNTLTGNDTDYLDETGIGFVSGSESNSETVWTDWRLIDEL